MAAATWEKSSKDKIREIRHENINENKLNEARYPYKTDTNTIYLLRFLWLQAQYGRYLRDADVLVNAADSDQIVLHHGLVQNAVPIARHLK